MDPSAPSPLAFPLLGKLAVPDPDSEAFARMDLSKACPIPVPGSGHPGAFAHVRRNHVHEGVDLYGLEGDIAVALFDGVVVAVDPFTGEAAGSPWWLPTMAVAVEGAPGVAFHGEIEPLPGIEPGLAVKAGTPLGRLARVLRHDKGRPLHMLHVELYERGVRASVGIWELGAQLPAKMLDPTELILRSAGIDPAPWINAPSARSSAPRS